MVTASQHIHDFEYNNYCGADICLDCNLHAHVRKDGVIYQELSKCYCGWNLAPGEKLEDDVVIEDGGFFGDLS